MINFNQLLHDLNNLSTKLEILSSELTEEDIQDKTQVYLDLVGALKDSQKLLGDLND